MEETRMFTSLSINILCIRFANSRFLLILLVLNAIFLFGAPHASLAATPVIFHATESAGPGDVVQLQGANFGAAPTVSIQQVSGSTSSLTPRQQLTVISKSDTSVSTQIPSSFPKGLYALWVSNGVLSQPVMINRARVNQLEFPEVDPGRTFRVFGRNLWLSGFTPTVRFVDQATGRSLSGTLVSAAGNDSYVYRVKASTNLQVGHTYAIYFRNGAGGKWGETVAANLLPVRGGDVDAFSLNVPWGADFAAFASKTYNVMNAPFNATGDGITDDRAAIQSAIDTASAAGGGVVYLPQATYNIVTFINGAALSMKSNVVLRGQSRAGTILKFSPVSDPGYPWNMIQWANDVTLSGLTQLTVFNNTSNTSYNLAIRDGGANTSKIFVKDVTIDLNKWGSSLHLGDGNRYLVDNVKILNPSIQGTVLMLSQPGSFFRTSHYALVRNCTFPNVTRRLQGGADTIIENNTVTYNGDYQAEVAALQPDFSQGEQNSIEIRDKTVMLNNTFTHAGSTLFNAHNDGETILNQMLSLNDVNQLQQDLGAVTSAEAATLSDISKDWSTLNWAGFIVAITDGPGTGQWRKIISNTKDTVTVDQAWQVVPTNTSRYTLMRFGIQTVLIKGNVLQNKERGMWFYTGGQDVAIVNNSLTDAAGIWVRALNHAPTKVFQVAWDILVANNQVTRSAAQQNPSGITGRSAHITASIYHHTPVTGSGILGVEVRDNVITAVPGPELSYGPVPVLRDGYTAAASYVGDDKFGSPDWTKASLRGVIFDGNSANNVETAYHVSSGAYQTIIANSSESGVSQRLQDVATYDGQLLNDAGWTADGLGNGALMLDGVNDRVSLGLVLMRGFASSHLSVFARAPVFTLEARVKMKPAANGTHAILDLANGPSTEPQWAIGAGKHWMHVGNAFFTGNRVVNDEQWHHVAASYDGTTLSFYVDGVLDASFAANLAPFNFNNGFWSIGAWLGSSWDVRATGEVTWPFNGALDEVRIWNIARSGTAIAADANRELTGSETGLMNYWRFNEGVGNFANDSAFANSVDTVLVTP